MQRRPGSRRMCDATVIKFIELYRGNQCLWNTACSGYGNGAAMNSAYRSISRQMRILGLGPREVARRIKNLNSVYQQESKRLRESRDSEGARSYKPRVVWYGLVDAFLKPVTKKEPCDCDVCSVNTLSGKLSGGESLEKSDERDTKLRENIQDSSKIQGDGKNMAGRETRIIVDEKSSEEPGGKSGNNCVACVSRISGLQSPSHDVRDDEYESFGRYIGAVLREMPFEYAVTAQADIHSIVIKYKVYSMRKPERNGYRCLEMPRSAAKPAYGNSSNFDRRIKWESRSNSTQDACKETNSKTSDEEGRKAETYI
ncbi:hypothetical protein KM043_012948 [Ampulex compressa]|nr:hypothetical protein KM043_012948 [Ampulex compressa]